MSMKAKILELLRERRLTSPDRNSVSSSEYHGLPYGKQSDN